MRSAPGVAARLTSVLARVFVDALLPLSVTYGALSGAQLVPFRVCCFDSKTGAAVDSLSGRPRVVAPWPPPAGCAVAPAILQQIDGLQSYVVEGPSLYVGNALNLHYQGDNHIHALGGQEAARLEAATNAQNPAARAEIVDAQPIGNVGGRRISFATLADRAGMLESADFVGQRCDRIHALRVPVGLPAGA